MLHKPGREPVAIHFVIDAKGRETVDAYYSDYAKFRKMVEDGTAGFDLTVPPEDDADDD